MAPWLRTLRSILWNSLPALSFVAIVGAWAIAIPLFNIPKYLLPAPDAVFLRLFSDWQQLWSNSLITLLEIVLGFGLTLVTAIPLGLVIALSPLAKQVVYPPLMFMQLVPKIAVAPLFLVWLGFGIESKVLAKSREVVMVKSWETPRHLPPQAMLLNTDRRPASPDLAAA